MQTDIYLQNNTNLESGGSSSLHFISLLVGELKRTSGDSVIAHVVESIHHTAAQGAAGDLHVTDIRPLASFGIIALNVKSGAEAIETSNHKKAAIHHCDAKVAAGFQHGGHRTPGVGLSVIGLNCAKTSGSIETTNL